MEHKVINISNTAITTLRKLLTAIGIFASVLGACEAAAQAAAGRVEQLIVHSAALEGNLNGDSPDRPVFI